MKFTSVLLSVIAITLTLASCSSETNAISTASNGFIHPFTGQEPREKIAAGPFHRQDKLVKTADVDGRVLQIDPDPIKPFPGHDLGHRRMADHDPPPQGRLASSQFLFRFAHLTPRDAKWHFVILRRARPRSPDLAETPTGGLP